MHERPTMLTVKRTTRGEVALVAWYGGDHDPVTILAPHTAWSTLTAAIREVAAGNVVQLSIVLRDVDQERVDAQAGKVPVPEQQ